MTIQELHEQLRKQTPFCITEVIRFNEPALRIGFCVENTKTSGIGKNVYKSDVLDFIPTGFKYIIKPNYGAPGEEIIIYKSKNENMQTVTLSNDGNSVLIDGVAYDKRKENFTIKPVSGLHVTMQEMPASIVVAGVEYELIEKKKNDPELKTFEDCWNAVKPRYWNHSTSPSISDNGISAFSAASAALQLPTEKTAKQIQAAIKLFVVRQALQGDWEPGRGTEHTPFFVWFNGSMGLLVGGLCGQAMHSPFFYKSEELAKKSIEIAGDIYKEWFGVK